MVKPIKKNKDVKIDYKKLCENLGTIIKQDKDKYEELLTLSTDLYKDYCTAKENLANMLKITIAAHQRIYMANEDRAFRLGFGKAFGGMFGVLGYVLFGYYVMLEHGVVWYDKMHGALVDFGYLAGV